MGSENRRKDVACPSETYYSQPYNMNNSMWAVGDAWDSNTSRRAFLFTPRKGMAITSS